eukprot:755889-Hanusia_phi.AAC.3
MANHACISTSTDREPLDRNVSMRCLSWSTFAFSLLTRCGSAESAEATTALALTAEAFPTGPPNTTGNEAEGGWGGRMSEDRGSRRERLLTPLGSCGICNGNNSCLDCKGVPYGSTVLDICGICGGRNDPQQCMGCDGKLYPRPLVPPIFDVNLRCCPVNQIGCNGICGATVGCDGVCAVDSKKFDK